MEPENQPDPYQTPEAALVNPDEARPARPGPVRAAIYWLFIIMVPFSVLAENHHSPPLIMGLALACGSVSALNRLRFSIHYIPRIFAGVCFLAYTALLLLLFYAYSRTVFF